MQKQKSLSVYSWTREYVEEIRSNLKKIWGFSPTNPQIIEYSITHIGKLTGGNPIPMDYIRQVSRLLKGKKSFHVTISMDKFIELNRLSKEIQMCGMTTVFTLSIILLVTAQSLRRIVLFDNNVD